MFDFYNMTSFLGNLLRIAGLAVFGIATSWFTVKIFHKAEDKWPLQAAVFLGFLFFTAITLAVVSAGSGGAFTLAAGIALLYWGNRKDGNTEPEEEEEGSK
jgi:hypothetical protein